jgi:16S rRNA (adenine1518-N6/adenine1519-N6)-dimethyltransferase
MYTAAEIRKIFREHGLAPKKWMGQNLLVDRFYLKRIVASADIRSGENIVEIGAGLGVLTEELDGLGAKVWALEVDSGFVRVLETKFVGSTNVTLIHADALKYDFRGLAEALGRLHVVANLPYSISSRLIFTFYENRDIFDSLHILLQKEVAERLAASPGTKDYGVLTVLLAASAHVEVLFHVPAEAFFPVPAVASSLVKITFPDVPPVAVSDWGLYTRLVKTAFAERRKTLRNTLRGLSVAGISPEMVSAAAERSGIDLARRGETVSAFEFARFTEAVCDPRGSTMEGIQKERPDQDKLEQLGIGNWSSWECEPSQFPWEYDEKETAYVFEGRVTVETELGQRVDIGPGDLVMFPKGLKCKWTVHETIRKVYKFG